CVFGHSDPVFLSAPSERDCKGKVFFSSRNKPVQKKFKPLFSHPSQTLLSTPSGTFRAFGITNIGGFFHLASIPPNLFLTPSTKTLIQNEKIHRKNFPHN
ncbi:hypothetical protein, partial [Algoriphagus limi]